jgi:twitching motility protein PilT
MITIQEQISQLFSQNTLAFSDIHIEVGGPICVRVPRGVVPVDSSKPVTKDSLLTFLRTFALGEGGSADEWQKKIDAGDGQYTARFKLPEATLRAALFNSGGDTGRDRRWSLSLRVQPKEVPAYADLGLPKELLSWLSRASGLIVFTGVTGSGKSTSMAAAVHYLNANFHNRIIMLEDPIEYVHPSLKSMVTQRELGTDFSRFDLGVKHAMRQDPDVIVVGEVNDLASLKAAVSAGLSGHLVITSMHTVNAAETVNRIIDLYPPEEKAAIRSVIAQLLVGVVSQKLLPSIDGKCRYLAHEIMEVTNAVRTLMREDKIQQLPNEINVVKPTMHLMNTSLAMLVEDHKIDMETALSASYEPDRLENFFGARIPDDSEG